MKNIYKLKLGLLALALSIGAIIGNAQTNVPSIISSNQTWTASGSPYVVTTTALIKDGVTVNIEPGVKVRGNGSNFKIIVDGELTAIGTKDSVIGIDSISFEFTEQSVDYDKSTGKGSQFQYCLFNNYTTLTIDLVGTSMLVKNCKFIDGFYHIQSTRRSPSKHRDTTELIVKRSLFTSVSGNGYPVNLHGYSFLDMYNCYAKNMTGIILGYNSKITNCTFENFNRNLTVGPDFSNVVLECNVFNNFERGILDLFHPGLNANLELTNNTFDSSRFFVSIRANKGKISRVVAKDNNFLSNEIGSIISGTGPTAGIADTLNFQNNYWGTGSSSSIDSGITDFKDDITLRYFIDYNNRRTAMVTTCSNGGTIGNGDSSDSTLSVQKTVRGNFKFYPNPANNLLTVDCGNQSVSSIVIYDINGKVCLKQSCNTSKLTIDLSPVKSGLYLIEINGTGFVNREKLIISH